MKKKYWFILLIVLILILGGVFFYKNNVKNSKIGNNKNSQEIVDNFLNLSSYEVQVTVNVTSNKNSNKYILKQTFNSPNISTQEVIEPSNIAGVRIENNGTNVKIENTNLKLSTLLENYNFEAKHREMQYEKNITNITGYLNNPITIYNNYHTLLVNYNLLLEEINNYNISINQDTNTKYMFDFEKVQDKEAIIFEEFHNQTKNNKSKVYR